MHKAIVSAYNEVLPPSHFPLYTIFLEVDPSRVDVNIHPTKIEAKFEEDQAIFAILRSTIKRGLGKHNVAPSLDFDTELSIQIDPLHSKRVVSEPRVKINPEFTCLCTCLTIFSNLSPSTTSSTHRSQATPTFDDFDFKLSTIVISRRTGLFSVWFEVYYYNKRE